MKSRAAFALVPAVALLCLAPATAWATDLLVNGNFDDTPFATGWVQDDGGSGYPPIVPGSELPPGFTAQSSPNLTWLGGLFSVTQSIDQAIAVPAGTTKLKLTGYLWIYSEEPGGQYDHLYAEILYPGGTEVLRHWTNLGANGGWTAFSLEAIGNYAGQTIHLRFRSTNDATFNTTFLLDTCVLDATPTVDVPRTSIAISRLYAARPNPTRGVARLRLDLAAPTMVKASIYDLSGRLVCRIAGQSLEAGSHDLTWDGKDAGGFRVPSSVYVCRVDVGGHSSSQRIALVH